MLCCGMLRVSETGVPSLWHWPQSLGISKVEVGEPGVDGPFSVSVPSHVLQFGARLSPRAVALPCRLAAYLVCSSEWHEPQSTGFSFSGCGKVAFSRSAWQLRHSSSACGEARKAAASKAGGTPASRRPVRRPVSWQSKQSFDPGIGLLSCAARVAASKPAPARSNALRGCILPPAGRGLRNQAGPTFRFLAGGSPETPTNIQLTAGKDRRRYPIRLKSILIPCGVFRQVVGNLPDGARLRGGFGESRNEPNLGARLLIRLRWEIGRALCRE